MNGGEVEILSTATSTQFPNHKTNKKNDTSKQLSKQAIRQGKLREITKCLLTRFSKLNGRYINISVFYSFTYFIYLFIYLFLFLRLVWYLNDFTDAIHVNKNGNESHFARNLREFGVARSEEREVNQRIGHFRVPKNLTFKTRLSAKPLLWKWVLFAS